MHVSMTLSMLLHHCAAKNCIYRQILHALSDACHSSFVCAPWKFGWMDLASCSRHNHHGNSFSGLTLAKENDFVIDHATGVAAIHIRIGRFVSTRVWPLDACEIPQNPAKFLFSLAQRAHHVFFF